MKDTAECTNEIIKLVIITLNLKFGNRLTEWKISEEIESIIKNHIAQQEARLIEALENIQLEISCVKVMRRTPIEHRVMAIANSGLASLKKSR